MSVRRAWTAGLVAVGLAGAASAHGPGWQHPHRHGIGWGLGIGLTVPLVVVPAPRTERREAVVAVAESLPPEPAFRGATGPEAARYEADRRDCDREAMARPAAMADARVFHLSALACMAGRGWQRAD